MVVDDLKDICFFNIINCLIHFIVVYKYYLFLVHTQEITSGYRTDAFSFLVDNRKGPMTMLDHNILYVICKIFGIKSYQIICFHDISDRNTLVDQSCNCKGIIW